jgi:hypothetical protein
VQGCGKAADENVPHTVVLERPKGLFRLEPRHGIPQETRSARRRAFLEVQHVEQVPKALARRPGEPLGDLIGVNKFMIPQVA